MLILQFSGLDSHRRPAIMWIPSRRWRHMHGMLKYNQHILYGGGIECKRIGRCSFRRAARNRDDGRSQSWRHSSSMRRRRGSPYRQACRYGDPRTRFRDSSPPCGHLPACRINSTHRPSCRIGRGERRDDGGAHRREGDEGGWCHGGLLIPDYRPGKSRRDAAKLVGTGSIRPTRR